MTEKKNVGYIGLGNIGKPSAMRLIGDAFNAHVYDVVQPAVDALVEAGAIGCTSVAELARSCEHIGICVRDDAQVEELLYGEEGILAHAAAGTLVAIHSTVTQANLLKWANQARERGIRLIDAPITGGAHKAVEGTLCYMVGGEEADVAAATPVFDTSAEKVIHAGELGCGIALKLCNNYMQYTEFVIMAEAARLAEACGLSPEVMRDVGLSNGVVNEQMFMFVTGRNGVLRAGPNPDAEAYFATMGALAAKDMDCALATAAEKGVTMPTAEFIRERIERVFMGQDESRPPVREE